MLDDAAFKAYMNALNQYVKPESKQVEPYEKGYALGRVMAQATHAMTTAEKHEFQEGVDAGIEYELFNSHSKTH